MSFNISKIVSASCGLLLLRSVACAGDLASVWPDTLLARVEALALVQTLNSDLLSHDSATLTLDRWCESHQLASPARIVAERVRGEDKTATPEQRQLLGLSPNDEVKYRRVRLHCGEHVLSEADNWYVPSRLTPEMNQQLETSDISFGRAVQALHFRRQTLSANLLWMPLPQGWEMGASARDDAGAALNIPSKVLGSSDELPEHDSNSGEQYEASVVCEELVVSGCDAPELLQFIEETLDEIALLVERLVVGERRAAIGF